MKRISYLPGAQLGSLIYLSESAPRTENKRKIRRGLFKCKCGASFLTDIRSAVSGNTRSCGCFTDLTPRRLRTSTHLLRKHPLYRIWCSIKTRCTNPKRLDYRYYGARGIKLSGEFSNDFKAFYVYVSALSRYEDREKLFLTLDRKDNSKGYCRGNLRWATRKEQANNRSKHG